MSLASYVPLTPSAAWASWTVDVAALFVITAATAGYAWSYRKANGALRRSQAWCFATGVVTWLLADLSVIAVYSPVLFWMRALQVLLLLLVVPFFLALSRPIAAVRIAAPAAARTIDRLLESRTARVVLSPWATSIAMLATPWLLYFTPWYVASMTGAAGTGTRLALVCIGFGYFFARLQVDPVPKRFTPLLSIGVSVIEGLADGVLGLTLWLGPVVAETYYEGLQRNWGPGIRLDQSIGAGILWILGDVLAVPFVAVLMRSLGVHERKRAAEVDDELTRQSDGDVPSGLWWEQDPQLRDRFTAR